MGAGEPSNKDVWDKLDIIAKGVLALVVSGGVAFYTTVVQQQSRDFQFEQQQENQKFQFRQQQDDRKAETLIRLVNQREESNSNLRSKMFDTMLQNFFSKEDPESQIVALQMIGLNFRDTLQIKPMFNLLDRQLNTKIRADINDNTSRELKLLLRKAARTIIQDQLDQIANADGGSVCELTLDLLDESGPKSSYCLQNRAFEIVSTSADEVRIQAYAPDIQLDLDPLAESSGWKATSNNFSITYFDMPMVDYTRLPDAAEPVYYSLVLRDLGVAEARVSVAVLPTADYSSRNAYKFDELVSDVFVEGND